MEARLTTEPREASVMDHRSHRHQPEKSASELGAATVP